jgi:hypothetical protein
MTIQVKEQVHWRSQRWALLAQPLQTWPMYEQWHASLAPLGSTCWRRYVGTWAIEDERLVLVALRANRASGEPVAVQDLFPRESGKGWANWFSGTARCVALDAPSEGLDAAAAPGWDLRFYRGMMVASSMRGPLTAAAS